MTTSSVALFIDPPTYHFEHDRLFELEAAPVSGDAILTPFIHLRKVLNEQGVEVHTADQLKSGDGRRAGANLYMSLGIRRSYAKLAESVTLSAFFVPECPVADPRLYEDLSEVSGYFKRMYSFSTDEAVRPFLREPISFRPFRYPYPFNDVDQAAWSIRDRRFLVIINANKVPRLHARELYTERLLAIEYFSRTGSIDLYGIGWDRPPVRIGSTRVPRSLGLLQYRARCWWHDRFDDPEPLVAAARSVYRGPVASKLQTLARYRFALCFENQILDGWVTEKMFDCFRAGAIPIYLGAPDIEEWVPRECFIDMRDFRDYGELRDYLGALTPAECDAYRQAARDYMTSERFFPFTKEAFTEIVASIVKEDSGVPLQGANRVLGPR